MGQIRAASYANDSFFVSVDNAAQQIFDMAENKWSPEWQWVRLNNRGTTGVPLAVPAWNLQLSSGQHTIQFRTREANSQLDQIVVTEDLNYIPQ